MRSSEKKRWAVLAGFALGYPWVLAATLLVHVHEHDHDHGESELEEAGVVELIVHGHQHDPGTPDHHHSLDVSNPLLERATPSIAPNLPAGSGLPRSATTASTAWYGCGPGVLGPSPPSQSDAVSILRI